jgi:poly(A) polymerase
MTGWREHARMVKYVLARHSEQAKRVAPTKLVDGHDLINIFGLKPGPAVGEILEAVREAQASAELASREEALDYIRQRLAIEKTLC